MTRPDLTPSTKPLKRGIAAIIAVLLPCLLPACAPFPQGPPSATVIPGGRVTLPLVKDGLMYVRTPVADAGEPQLLMIDTGAWCLTLSPETAAQLKARQRPTLPYPSFDVAGTLLWQCTTYHVDEMRIGEARIQGLDAEVRPVHMYTGAPGLAGGMLGIDVFRGCLLTLNFPASELVLEQGELPPPDGKTILPFRRIFDDVEIHVTLAGQPVWAKIDTGAFDHLLISDDIAAHLPFQQPLTDGETISGIFGKEAPSKKGTLDGTLKFGQYEMPNPAVRTGGRSGRVLLGLLLLNQFRVTIDQKNQRIRFARP
jgi:hypothetical protein